MVENECYIHTLSAFDFDWFDLHDVVLPIRNSTASIGHQVFMSGTRFQRKGWNSWIILWILPSICQNTKWLTQYNRFYRFQFCLHHFDVFFLIRMTTVLSLSNMRTETSKYMRTVQHLPRHSYEHAQACQCIPPPPRSLFRSLARSPIFWLDNQFNSIRNWVVNTVRVCREGQDISTLLKAIWLWYVGTTMATIGRVHDQGASKWSIISSSADNAKNRTVVQVGTHRAEKSQFGSAKSTKIGGSSESLVYCNVYFSTTLRWSALLALLELIRLPTYPLCMIHGHPPNITACRSQQNFSYSASVHMCAAWILAIISLTLASAILTAHF